MTDGTSFEAPRRIRAPDGTTGAAVNYLTLLAHGLRRSLLEGEAS